MDQDAVDSEALFPCPLPLPFSFSAYCQCSSPLSCFFVVYRWSWRSPEVQWGTHSQLPARCGHKNYHSPDELSGKISSVQLWRKGRTTLWAVMWNVSTGSTSRLPVKSLDLPEFLIPHWRRRQWLHDPTWWCVYLKKNPLVSGLLMEVSGAQESRVELSLMLQGRIWRLAWGTAEPRTSRGEWGVLWKVNETIHMRALYEL